MSSKQVIYLIISDDTQSRIGKLFDHFISWLITLNILAIIAQSYETLDQRYSAYFYIFEVISVLVFSVEYILRLWTADLKYPEEKSYPKAVLRFVTSWMGLIDLLAILPFYAPFMFQKLDMRFLRILRLMRLIRILKLQRHSTAFKMVREVLKEVRPDITVTLFVTFILMVFASSMMYFVESEAQPDKFSNIGDSFWWAVATLTTVGYGDVYPVTPLGKIISGVIAILGIGMVALPTGVISSAFIDRVHARKQKKREENDVEILQHIQNIELKIDRLNEIDTLKKTLAEKDAYIKQLEQQLNR